MLATHYGILQFLKLEMNFYLSDRALISDRFRQFYFFFLQKPEF